GGCIRRVNMPPIRTHRTRHVPLPWPKVQYTARQSAVYSELHGKGRRRPQPHTQIFSFCDSYMINWPFVTYLPCGCFAECSKDTGGLEPHPCTVRVHAGFPEGACGQGRIRGFTECAPLLERWRTPTSAKEQVGPENELLHTA